MKLSTKNVIWVELDFQDDLELLRKFIRFQLDSNIYPIRNIQNDGTTIKRGGFRKKDVALIKKWVKNEQKINKMEK